MPVNFSEIKKIVENYVPLRTAPEVIKNLKRFIKNVENPKNNFLDIDKETQRASLKEPALFQLAIILSGSEKLQENDPNRINSSQVVRTLSDFMGGHDALKRLELGRALVSANVLILSEFAAHRAKVKDAYNSIVTLITDKMIKFQMTGLQEAALFYFVQTMEKSINLEKDRCILIYHTIQNLYTSDLMDLKRLDAVVAKIKNINLNVIKNILNIVEDKDVEDKVESKVKYYPELYEHIIALVEELENNSTLDKLRQINDSLAKIGLLIRDNAKEIDSSNVDALLKSIHFEIPENYIKLLLRIPQPGLVERIAKMSATLSDELADLFVILHENKLLGKPAGTTVVSREFYEQLPNLTKANVKQEDLTQIGNLIKEQAIGFKPELLVLDIAGELIGFPDNHAFLTIESIAHQTKYPCFREYSFQPDLLNLPTNYQAILRVYPANKCPTFINKRQFSFNAKGKEHVSLTDEIIRQLFAQKEKVTLALKNIRAKKDPSTEDIKNIFLQIFAGKNPAKLNEGKKSEAESQSAADGAGEQFQVDKNLTQQVSHEEQKSVDLHTNIGVNLQPETQGGGIPANDLPKSDSVESNTEKANDGSIPPVAADGGTRESSGQSPEINSENKKPLDSNSTPVSHQPTATPATGSNGMDAVQKDGNPNANPQIESAETNKVSDNAAHVVLEIKETDKKSEKDKISNSSQAFFPKAPPSSAKKAGPKKTQPKAKPESKTEHSAAVMKV